VRCKDMMTGVAVGEYLLDGVRKDWHGEMVQRKERGRERTGSEMTMRQSGKEAKAQRQATV
jgi:hypothetical protein